MVLTLHFYEEARSNEGAYIGTSLYKHMTAKYEHGHKAHTVTKIGHINI